MDKTKRGCSQPGKDERYDFVNYIEELKDRLDIVQVAELRGITVNKHGQAECFNNHDQKTPQSQILPREPELPLLRVQRPRGT